MHRGSAASRACTSAPGRALCPQRAASAPGLSQRVPPLWPLLLTAQARSHAGPMALPGTVSRDPHQPRPHGCRGHQVGSAASLERCSFPQAQPESQERGHFLSSHRCMLLPITNVTGTAFTLLLISIRKENWKEFASGGMGKSRSLLYSLLQNILKGPGPSGHSRKYHTGPLYR